MPNVTIIGAGLAGSEAAWQAAKLGCWVELWEMRPQRETPAHRTEHFAELVCSNSLGNRSLETACGLLKEELRHLGSVILHCADANPVPAGGALGVAREDFPRAVTETIHAHPNIEVIRKEVTDIPQGPTVVATGPLTSDALAKKIEDLSAAELSPIKDFEEDLYFEGCLPVETIARRGKETLRFGPMKPVGLPDP